VTGQTTCPHVHRHHVDQTCAPPHLHHVGPPPAAATQPAGHLVSLGCLLQPANTLIQVLGRLCHRCQVSDVWQPGWGGRVHCEDVRMVRHEKKGSHVAGEDSQPAPPSIEHLRTGCRRTCTRPLGPPACNLQFQVPIWSHRLTRKHKGRHAQPQRFELVQCLESVAEAAVPAEDTGKGPAQGPSIQHVL